MLEGAALKLKASQENPYLMHADPHDPLAFPVRSKEVLAKFPPSLLIGSTRDFALSSVVHTHTLLVQQGVEAELHVWEGLGHAFFMDPDLPQSRDLYGVVVKFFDKNLGRFKAPPATPASSGDSELESALSAEVEHFVAADRASPPKRGQIAA